jgi:uncharacterized protein YfaS (alpha-2-macroglobulin family)
MSGIIGMSHSKSLLSEVSWTFNGSNSILRPPKFKVMIYTKPLENILDAIESLLKEPFGCFEQTSSVTYPMVMALNLLLELKKSVFEPNEITRIDKLIENMKS